MKTAIITGGTGYIGSNLARQLVIEGWNIHIISRDNSSLHYIKDIIDEVNLFKYDGNIKSLIKCFRAINTQVVFHLASFVQSDNNLIELDNLLDSNIKFGVHILQAMKESKVTNIISTGTYWQHYNNDEYNPVNLYAATKQAFESILRYYTEACGIRAITLELFDTYGPNDNRPKIINLLKDISKNNKTLNMSLGEQMLDLVYIDDVVQAYVVAANNILKDKAIVNNKYAVSTGDPVSLRRLVELFEEVYSVKLDINWGERPYRNREVMTTWDKGKILPNWKPEVSLIEGLKRLKDT